MQLLRLLVPVCALALIVAGCNAGDDAASDGKKNPPATRLTEAEFEAKRAKKGEPETER